MTVQCPWCSYEGMVSSVEAHISGKADENHRGKVGHDLHQHLPQPDGSGEESSESDLAGSLPDLPDSGGESNVSAGWVLVAATVVFLLVVIVTADTGGGVEEIPAAEENGENEEDQDEETEQVALVE